MESKNRLPNTTATDSLTLSLAGKHALVCGASKGIGRCTALALAKSGANITVLSRSSDTLNELLPLLTAAGAPKAWALPADLDDRSSLLETVSRHISETGAVHVLVNNAGGPAGGPIIDASTSEFELAFGRHVLASHIMTQAVVKGMVDQNFGRIINIISTSVREPIPRLGVSNTVRGAMAGWAKSMARELPEMITINNVLPGFTDTERLGALAAGRAKREGCTPEDVRKMWLNDVPAGRLAKPDETAAAIAFLASPAAGNIRGVSLAVDGGRMRSI